MGLENFLLCLGNGPPRLNSQVREDGISTYPTHRDRRGTACQHAGTTAARHLIPQFGTPLAGL